ncbi:hypothetical protein [Leptospira kirschneri]|uniref:Uncharacterized protein n=2 Tax=Leptospira kirschneri TaxID=29507 RepID=A0A0E2AYD6_9LEPT|nr:hypothetical protein [Leptospira kirschneri]EKO13974.1 hypothetical protein LEP1GSC081_0260 [Leptospira kirschneri str. H1]EKO58568.1 hypothetical protein LEP1GSC082_1939 [Leptospira kirschneri str. H2]EMK22785.1 hypothetical protein LEP1GSC008_0856 [Leptospira kirschneri serovar Bulgarica str. Nikolaevo]
MKARINRQKELIFMKNWSDNLRKKEITRMKKIAGYVRRKIGKYSH